MKAAVGGIAAAVVASACCIGPVAFSVIGVGAFGASAVRLEPYRLVHRVYRPAGRSRVLRRVPTALDRFLRRGRVHASLEASRQGARVVGRRRRGRVDCIPVLHRLARLEM